MGAWASAWAGHAGCAELRAECLSLRAIAAAMAERGLRTSGVKPYGANAVLKMVAGQ
jgi:hypothetical protein